MARRDHVDYHALLVACHENLVKEIENHADDLADALHQNSMLSDDQLEEIHEERLHVKKARGLIVLIKARIKSFPLRFEDFMAILRKSHSKFGTLIKLLEDGKENFLAKKERDQHNGVHSLPQSNFSVDTGSDLSVSGSLEDEKFYIRLQCQCGKCIVQQFILGNRKNCPRSSSRTSLPLAMLTADSALRNQIISAYLDIGYNGYRTLMKQRACSMQASFKHFLSETINDLKKITSLHKLKAQLTTLITPQGANGSLYTLMYTREMKGQLQELQSFDELEMFLEYNYCSWFNIELLCNLRAVFLNKNEGTDPEKARYKAYVSAYLMRSCYQKVERVERHHQHTEVVCRVHDITNFNGVEKKYIRTFELYLRRILCLPENMKRRVDKSTGALVFTSPVSECAVNLQRPLPSLAPTNSPNTDAITDTANRDRALAGDASINFRAYIHLNCFCGECALPTLVEGDICPKMPLQSEPLLVLWKGRRQLTSDSSVLEYDVYDTAIQQQARKMQLKYKKLLRMTFVELEKQHCSVPDVIDGLEDLITPRNGAEYPLMYNEPDHVQGNLGDLRDYREIQVFLDDNYCSWFNIELIEAIKELLGSDGNDIEVSVYKQFRRTFLLLCCYKRDGGRNAGQEIVCAPKIDFTKIRDQQLHIFKLELRKCVDIPQHYDCYIDENDSKILVFRDPEKGQEIQEEAHALLVSDSHCDFPSITSDINQDNTEPRVDDFSATLEVPSISRTWRSREVDTVSINSDIASPTRTLDAGNEGDRDARTREWVHNSSKVTRHGYTVPGPEITLGDSRRRIRMSFQIVDIEDQENAETESDDIEIDQEELSAIRSVFESFSLKFKKLDMDYYEFKKPKFLDFKFIEEAFEEHKYHKKKIVDIDLEFMYLLQQLQAKKYKSDL